MRYWRDIALELWVSAPDPVIMSVPFIVAKHG